MSFEFGGYPTAAARGLLFPPLQFRRSERSFIDILLSFIDVLLSFIAPVKSAKTGLFGPTKVSQWTKGQH